MIIKNAIECENCGAELQPEDIMLDLTNDGLVRICAYCGNRTEVEIENKCENCNEEKVEHPGDWCDDCNLPERSAIQ